MINSPIWKDIELTSTADTLDYEIWDESAHTIHNGITMRMPDNTGITLNVNTRLEEYLKPDFASDFTDTADDVLNNPNGYREFRYMIPGEILETYGFLYDWSYEENWSGQTRYNMTKPINGHIDGRMKCMFTNYNTGVTSMDWELEYETTLKVSKSSLMFNVPAGHSQQVSIVTNSDWEITSMPSWLSADTMSGEGCYSAKTDDVVTFTTTATNPDDTKRTAYVVVSYDNGNKSKTIEVSQYGIILSVVPTSVRIAMDGTVSDVIRITYNYMYSLNTEINWLTYSTSPAYYPMDGSNEVRTVELTITPISVGVNRSGTLRFVQGNVVRTVEVNQEGYVFHVTPQSLSFASTGQTKTVTVSGNTDWSVSYKPNWITISPSAGTSGVQTVNITATANVDDTRNDYATFIYANSAGTRTVSLTQDSALIVSPSILNYPLEGGNRTLKVTSLVPFYISGSTFSGLTFSSTSGASSANITVTCEGRVSAETNYSYEFTVYNQYKSIKVYVVQASQWDPTGDISLHTTYIATGSTTQQYPLYGALDVDTISIDGGPFVTSPGYATFTPGIHTVDFKLTNNTFGNHTYYSPFNGTTLYTLEVNNRVGGSLSLNVTRYLKEVYTGGVTLLDNEGGSFALEKITSPSSIPAFWGGYFTSVKVKELGPINTTGYSLCYYSRPYRATYQNPDFDYGPGPFFELSAFTGTSSQIAGNGRILCNNTDMSSSGSCQYYYSANEIVQAAATGGLTAYTVPNGIKVLDYMSFAQQPISKLTLPNTVERIAFSFMNESNISEWNIPSSVKCINGEINGCEWWVEQEGPLCINDGWCIATKGFSGTTMQIPEGVIGTSIGGFNDYYTTHDYDATYYDPLGPENRSVISAVTTVILPSTLKYLGNASFTNRWPSSGYGWNSLTDIYCYATTAPEITNPDGFQGIRNGGTLHVPAGSDYSSWMTFYYVSSVGGGRSNHGLSAYYWSIVYDLPPVPQTEKYLTFNITGDGYINWKKKESGSTVKSIEYRKNYGNWTSISTTTSGNKINVTSGDLVEFRGANTSYSGATFSGTTATFTLEGNIMSLIAKTGFNTLTGLTVQHTFYELFAGCTGLTDASNLQLPATELIDGCYTSMFSGCTALTAAPALPATSLDDYCYTNMFSNCTSLVNAPALPATALTYDCYTQMFLSCSSLRNAPELPATRLAPYCYGAMFAGCTSLTEAPELPATNLEHNCYDWMFNSCTSLTEAPELPATTLAERCYRAMFAYCTSLTTAPALPATTLGYECYGTMFAGCTSLTTAPALPATALTSSCYSSMFSGCTSMVNAPELPATTLVNWCYTNMFNGCSSLSNITCLATSSISSTNTENWVYGVSPTGTFTKASSATWSTGIDGIPSGWTVTDAQ